MTPTLIVWLKLNGLPMAMTQSPGATWFESPSLASGSGVFGLSMSWIRALSVSWSRPMTLARYAWSGSSPKRATSILVAPSTTWLFVRM